MVLVSLSCPPPFFLTSDTCMCYCRDWPGDASRHPQGPQQLSNPFCQTLQFPDMMLSPSQDKTIIVWKLTRGEGMPQHALQGDSNFVSDVVVSSHGHFALSVCSSSVGSHNGYHQTQTCRPFQGYGECGLILQQVAHCLWLWSTVHCLCRGVHSMYTNI